MLSATAEVRDAPGMLVTQSARFSLDIGRVAWVAGRLVSKQPPWSIAMSTITEPGRIAAIRPDQLCAALPAPTPLITDRRRDLRSQCLDRRKQCAVRAGCMSSRVARSDADHRDVGLNPIAIRALRRRHLQESPTPPGRPARRQRWRCRLPSRQCAPTWIAIRPATLIGASSGSRARTVTFRRSRSRPI